MNLSSLFKRISHHGTKFVEFFVKEHHTLYQTCEKVDLFISIRNLFSTRVFFYKINKNAEGYLKNTITYNIIVLS